MGVLSRVGIFGSVWYLVMLLYYSAMQKLVFAYLRVSPTLRDQGDNSIERQEEIVKEYYEGKDVELVWFIDRFVSAKNIEGRVEFKKLLEAVKDRKPSEIIITKVDRMFRSLRNMIEVNEDHFGETVLISIKERITTDNKTPAGKAFVQMLAVFGELERAIIVERNTSGIRDKTEELKAEGKNWGPTQLVFTKQDKQEILRLWNNGNGLSLRDIAGRYGCSTTPIGKIIHGKR